MLMPHFKNIQDQIISYVNKADYSIHVAVAWFSNANIIVALNNASSRGVKVDVLISDDPKYNNWTVLRQLQQTGADVGYVHSDVYTGHGRMHNKFCIIDAQLIITGSYNYTSNAENNSDENIIVVHDALQAYKYLQEFENLKNKSKSIDNKEYTHNIININALPAPLITIKADKNLLRIGESTTIFWHVANADKIFINNEQVQKTGNKNILAEYQQPIIITLKATSIKGEYTKDLFIRCIEFSHQLNKINLPTLNLNWAVKFDLQTVNLNDMVTLNTPMINNMREIDMLDLQGYEDEQKKQAEQYLSLKNNFIEKSFNSIKKQLEIITSLITKDIDAKK